LNKAYDVVVVGAGVAGLYASLRLASMGWNVALVESKPTNAIGSKVCGDALGVHHLNELDLTVPEAVIDHKYRGVKLYSPSKNYSIIVPGEGVSLNRLKFGQWLLKQALDNGVELLDRHVAFDVVLKENRVKGIKVKKVDSEVLELEAKLFIDASGYRPAIRSKLPREWPISERPYVSDYNIAYREIVEVEGRIIDENTANYALIYLDVEAAPGGYWWLFPKTPTGTVVNVGLGVVNSGEYNPKIQYSKHVKPLLKGRTLHAGGGVVPTRRPLSTLIWRNVAVVGDAAYAVNPVHGGGIGSSMLSAHIVSKYASSALEVGEIGEDTMWQANVDYMYAYGAKQASLDVLRMYMQKLSNNDYEWIMENKIVDGSSVYDLGVKGDLVERVAHSISVLIKLLGRPSLLNQLRLVKSYMGKARELYSTLYPRNPKDLRRWIPLVEGLFEEYVNVIGYNRGSLVKW